VPLSRHVHILLAAALLAPACADPVEIGVKLTLDEESCTVTDLAAVHLRCNATVGVWLRSGPSRSDYLRRTCVDVPDGASLDELNSVLEDVALPTTSSEAIWLEVAVWGPWSVVDGCVHPDNLDDVVDGALPETIAWGESQPIDLSDSTRQIQVVLGCVEVDRPGELDTCDESCMAEEQWCFERAGAQECLDEYEECVDPCDTEATCVAECDGKYNGCLADTTPDGVCELQFQACAGGCEGNDVCFEDCLDEQDSCIQGSCRDVHEECVAEWCDPWPMCHAVVDG
jgi:hypothetical protein